jgi:hypothetical protein
MKKKLKIQPSYAFKLKTRKTKPSHCKGESQKNEKESPTPK